MGQDRLSNLALMHVNYDMDISTKKVVQIFNDKHPRRLEVDSLLLES